MSKADPAAPQLAVSEAQSPTLSRVIRSEWIKFRTLRSSKWLIACAMLVMIAIGILIGYNTRHLAANIQLNDADQSGPLQGYYMATYLLGALGVVFVTGEYATGMVSSTFAAVPKRVPVFVAKTIIIFAVSWIGMTISTVVTFLGSQALISHFRTGFSLSDSVSLRVVFGTGLYLALLSVLASALGWIIRKTAGAIVTFFAVAIALPLLLSLFGKIGESIAAYSPILAGSSFIQAHPEPHTLSGWVGLIVLLAWILVGLSGALWRLISTDA